MVKTAIFSFLISVLALAVSLFQFEKFQIAKNQFENHLETLDRLNPKITELEQAVQILKGTQIQAGQQGQQIQLEQSSTDPSHVQSQPESQSQIQSQQAQAQTQLHPHYNPLPEITSLVHSSVMQLEVAENIQSAIALLNLADNIIELSHDSNLFILRESIVRDKKMLEAFQLPDVEGIWFKISILLEQVDALPSKLMKAGYPQTQSLTQAENQQATALETKPETNKMWQAIKDSLHEFKDLIKIQRHDKPIEPLLSKEESILAKEHLKLLLEQIRWAALHKQSKIYESSIQETQKWLESYFEISDPKVQQFQKTLSELSIMTLKPNFPVLSTLQQIQTLRQ